MKRLLLIVLSLWIIQTIYPSTFYSNHNDDSNKEVKNINKGNVFSLTKGNFLFTATTNSIYDTVCDQYTGLNGTTWTVRDTYMDTTTNNHGFDSTTTCHLIILALVPIYF